MSGKKSNFDSPKQNPNRNELRISFFRADNKRQRDDIPPLPATRKSGRLGYFSWRPEARGNDSAIL